MKNNDNPPSNGAKPGVTRKRKSAAGSRRTRYLALEPRVVFDGALGADVVDKVTQAPEASHPAAAALQATTPPADTGIAAPVGETAARPTPAAEKPGQDTRSVAERTAGQTGERESLAEGRSGLAGDPAATGGTVVFVDTSVANYHALLNQVDRSARVVLLDPTLDGVEQMTRFLRTQSNVGAVHIIAQGTDETLRIGTAKLDAVSMQGAYSAQLGEIGTHLAQDARIVVHGSDFGKGEAGHSVAARLAAITGADVEDADLLPERPVDARREVVFVDATLSDYRALLADINNPDARVVLLNGARDSIDQMADYLDGESGIDAVHIIGHGRSGTLILAGQAYTADTLSQHYAMDLARIGRALTADGDILLYGCDIAKGSAGETFIERVAAMTGADIAASIDRTGTADFGGNLVLESSAGAIEAPAILSQLQDQFGFMLLTATVDVGNGTLHFNGANRTQVNNGIADLQAGAVYKYANVISIGGTQVDAYVTTLPASPTRRSSHWITIPPRATPRPGPPPLPIPSHPLSEPWPPTAGSISSSTSRIRSATICRSSTSSTTPSTSMGTRPSPRSPLSRSSSNTGDFSPTPFQARPLPRTSSSARVCSARTGSAFREPPVITAWSSTMWAGYRPISMR